MVNGRRLMRFVRRAAVIGLVLVTALWLGSSWLIGSGVHAASEAALLGHPGDRVLALMAYVESPTHSLRERNRAVWALGQLGDARALPVLETHFTGRDCEHDRALCQDELRKAIRLCRGATNISAFVWR
jgi:HEAT repeat protein